MFRVQGLALSEMWGLEFEVEGLKCGVQGLRICGWPRVKDLVLEVLGSVFSVECLGSRVEGLGCFWLS